MRISDWSSDVCSSDLTRDIGLEGSVHQPQPQLLPGDGAALEIDLEGNRETGGRMYGNRAVAVVHPDRLPHLDRPPRGLLVDDAGRSEERRVGKECVSTCRSRGTPYH